MNMPAEYTYPGTELDLFAQAIRWKNYFSGKLQRYILGDVLEVGAGTGVNQPYLMHAGIRQWTSLEPDAALLHQLRKQLEIQTGAHPHRILHGNLKSLSATERFDTILYLDVLEHIEADQSELQSAAALLKPTGNLIVLAPAHPLLMSPFDRAIGHYRRYNKKTLQQIAPADLQLVNMFYLDAAGCLASMANRYLLHQRMPKPNQILFWDRRMIPVSRILDPLTGYRLGKTIVAIWKKPGS